jgi:hypothetical protein
VWRGEKVAANPVRANTVQAQFNHVFLTVDSKTHRDITECSFFTSEIFGRFRIKETTSTLTGFYRTSNVMGESTFVEFFPDSAPPFEGVRLGLVLSFDRAEQWPIARQTLIEQGAVPVSYELVRRMVPGEKNPQPWYHHLSPDFGSGSPFTMFLSEVTPEYFMRIGAKPGQDGLYGRSAYLAATFKAAQKPEHYLQDITAAKMRLRPNRAAALAATLRLLGYRQHDSGAGTRLQGPNVDLEIVADEERPEGLLELRLGLKRPYPKPNYKLKFGNSSALVLSPEGKDDKSGIWQFMLSESEV